MKTTFGRTFSALAILLLGALLLIGISFQLLVKNYLVEETVSDLKNDAAVLSELIQAYYADSAMSHADFSVALSVSSAVSDADVVICDHTGKLLVCANEPFGCAHQGMTVGAEYLSRVYTTGCSVDTGVLEGLYSDPRYVVSVPIPATNGGFWGIIILSAPVLRSTAVLQRISDIFIFVSVLVIVISVIVLTVFLRQQSKPLRQMAQAAGAFAHGDFSARIETDGAGSEEVEELALAFNNMASSLQKSEYQRQEFVANVSHELKTPMTAIAGYVDGILDGTIPPEKSRQYLQIVSDETKRLNRLVRSMLDISRLQDQGGIPEEQKLRFDLTEAAGQTLLNFEQKILGKGLEVRVDMPEYPVYAMANPDAITQVIYNLVDNGVKFCPEGGELALTVREGGGKLYVSVSNDGPTIPAEELPLVFDRFHKIDKSRSKNRDSWGLGLYIVKTILDSHGENISVTSREGRTTFTFTLPQVN